MRAEDLRALRLFLADFLQARARLLYLGSRNWRDRGIEIMPLADCLRQLDRYL